MGLTAFIYVVSFWCQQHVHVHQVAKRLAQVNECHTSLGALLQIVV